jgi:hypothetical protein
VTATLALIEDASITTEIPEPLRNMLSARLSERIQSNASPSEILSTLLGFFRTVADSHTIPEKDTLMAALVDLASLCEEFE